MNNNTPFDEIGYKSEKYNYLDTLTLVHCFRKLKFKDPDMCHIIVDHAEAEPEEEIAPRGLLSLFPGRKLSLVTCNKTKKDRTKFSLQTVIYKTNGIPMDTDGS